MRTLALLAALLLLAFQARAETLPEKADQVPAQDQPGAEDQDLFEDEDREVAISFPEGGRLTRQLGLPPFAVCKCRFRLSCKTFERNLGSCGKLGLSKLCCK
ncbi:neutrophil defensin 6-like [Phyllostomus hastatus]|uniref:neutrophil defensin 6-like n=1 Tax=Phyllostomus hastatus TaxID=9423 RepID=UPI001E684FBD|nr:neutrophil defensin 6-like [Phyllostomus hastatus]